MQYTVRLTRQAEKDIVRLRADKARAVTALSRLKADPYAGHTLTGSLKGVRSLEFSAPGGAYRAAYVVKDQECVVFLVGPHEGFYEKAERRYRALQRLGSL